MFIKTNLRAACILFTFGAFAVASGCSSEKQNQIQSAVGLGPSDAELRSFVVGSWRLTVESAHILTFTFAPGGVLRIEGDPVNPSFSDSFNRFLSGKRSVSGTWRIESGVLTFTMDNEPITIGVTKLSDDQMQLGKDVLQRVR